MPARKKRLVVLVHGWSVTSTETYGELPARLAGEAQAQAGLDLDIKNIWLGKYVSFRDEVRLEDISRGFQAAVNDQLGAEIDRGRRFVCITHSTGGPVVRDWWNRYYPPGGPHGKCPMSHLIMLAPANFGSALAQLGKGRLSNLKSWMKGVEPGQGVLDWLELGSPESWMLNREWFLYPENAVSRNGVYPFVLTGQSIDRKFYDHVNSYTGETGSDGVVRVAAANLNANYVRLEQAVPRQIDVEKDRQVRLQLKEALSGIRTAFAIIPGRSHSGDEMGILRSIGARGKHPTVDAVLECLLVQADPEYRSLCRKFEDQNRLVMRDEKVEVHGHGFFPDTYTIHDAHSMVVFRVQDDRGYALSDFDLKLTAGIDDAEPSADLLPKGFFADRQRNSRHRGTVTYFLNHDVVTGAGPLRRKIGKDRKPRLIRPAQKGVSKLGMEFIPRPRDGYAHYLKATLSATTRTLKQFLVPNQTTLVDIVLRRIVHEGVFQLTRDTDWESFEKQPEGQVIE
jgi:hypothetical protein